MELIKIEKILKNHSIDFKKINNRIYAIEIYNTGEDLVDVTDFSLEKLKSWLGY